MSILTGLLLFLTPFIKQINQMWEQQQEASYLEIQIGKKQLEHEIKELKLIEVKLTELVYQKKETDKDEEIIIDLYEDKLRKTPGFHPIIIGLKSVNFVELDTLIEMTLTTLKGETYVYFLKK